MQSQRISGCRAPQTDGIAGAQHRAHAAARPGCMVQGAADRRAPATSWVQGNALQVPCTAHIGARHHEPQSDGTAGVKHRVHAVVIGPSLGVGHRRLDGLGAACRAAVALANCYQCYRLEPPRLPPGHHPKALCTHVGAARGANGWSIPPCAYISSIEVPCTHGQAQTRHVCGARRLQRRHPAVPCVPGAGHLQQWRPASTKPSRTRWRARLGQGATGGGELNHGVRVKVSGVQGTTRGGRAQA